MGENMRIGIVTPRYPPTVAGGGEISVKLLADHLVARGDSVTIYTFDGGDADRVDGVLVRRFPSLPRGLMEVSNTYVASVLHRRRAELASLDVLHGYNVTLTPALGWLSSRIEVPSVATLNSYDLLPKSAFGVSADPPRRFYELLAMPTTGRILRSVAARTDQFITLSDASKRVYREHGFVRTPITTVPNMFDPSFNVPDATGDDETFDLLYVGSLIKEKGVEYLVRAMAELPSDICLRVVGSGNRSSHLRSLAEDIGVKDRIEFAGAVPYEAVRRHYATADCFVHPGVWPEPFGRTILEAMQAGLPVVATDIGGPAETVPQANLRCPPRDPAALADAVVTARDSPTVGESNRQHVHEHFAPNTVVDRIHDVYDRAIDG